MSGCPNCAEAHASYDVCVLGALMGVVHDRYAGIVSDTVALDDAIIETINDTDADALWDEVGPIVDMLAASVMFRLNRKAAG